MGVFLLSLSVLLVTATAVKAQARYGGCFSAAGCSRTRSVSASSAEDCCVNNPNGLYFRSGRQCLECIVYGWGASRFTKPENELPYQIPLAYFKGPKGSKFNPIRILLNIIDSAEGTADRDTDYTQNDNRLSLILDPDETTSVTFRPDNDALEPDETIVLDLSLVAVTGTGGHLTNYFAESLPNVFFQKRTMLFIQDTTELIFHLRELAREEDEDNGAIQVRVGMEYPLDLVSRITLLLTPKVAPVGFTPEPHFLPFARANTYTGRLDFPPDPIKVTFPVGKTRNIVVDVPIVDDDINEALEIFIVELSFADPSSVPSTVSIGRNVMRCDIVDNDDIFVGFQLPNTTYPEVEQSHQVTLIKGAGNVTEQTLFTEIKLVSTAPLGTFFDVATPSDNAAGIDNDLSFGGWTNSLLWSFSPDMNEINLPFTIFGDELPENTEAALLRIEVLTEETQSQVRSPRLKILPEFPTFFIIISDNDRYRVGFQTLSYTVNEGMGSVGVCFRMFEPSIGTPITGSFFFRVEPADNSGYTDMSGFGAVPMFNNHYRNSCIYIRITDDLVYENEERFTLQLTGHGINGISLPDNFVLSPDTVEIIIQDNEMVTVGFIDAPYSAREEDGRMIFTVGVTSGHILDRDIELSFTTGGISAFGGVDYIANPVVGRRFVLNGDKMTFQIPVEILHNSEYEQDETFAGNLRLRSRDRVTLSTNRVIATILDDKRPSVPNLVGVLECIAVVWNAPSYVIGGITKYEVRFVIPGAADMISIVNGARTYHPIPLNIRNNRPRVTFQVRARTAIAVGRWSPLMSLGC